MILRSVKYTNFGIFGHAHAFDLTPHSSETFNRPIVLFRGKNGVGKTTFVEGIRLCLHGPLALGQRIGQREYEEYLERRIHRRFTDAEETEADQPQSASVEIEFDFVQFGEQTTFRVRRSWARRGTRIDQTLDIWEGDQRLAMERDEKESLLREMIPPGVLDLFFFDGEEIEALARDDGSHLLLADTVKNLLGLHLVEQLGKDLDIYIARNQSEQNADGLQAELAQLRNQEETLKQQGQSQQHELEQVTHTIERIQRALSEQEQQLAQEGGAYAAKRQALQERKLQLEVEIDGVKRQAQELCSGLLPFAVAPAMLRQVRDRLHVEKEYEEEQTAHQLHREQMDRLHECMGKPEFWLGTAVTNDADQQQVYQQVSRVLEQTLPQSGLTADDVILHVSDKERSQLLDWIEQALSDTPRQFVQVIQELATLEEELGQVQSELLRVPGDEVLQPITQQIIDLNRELGAAEDKRNRLQDELKGVAHKLEQLGYAIQRIHNGLSNAQSTADKVNLAARTQLVLNQYQAKLTQRKLNRLEQSLVSHFNKLCRKQSFIDGATIDPDSYKITLHRAGQRFSRRELSAGEKQLFAIATLWALREISGRPVPVVIDTPLSRLDSEHRVSMIQHFFPHASHQVIILATDAEIDDQTEARLAPAISHIYHLWEEAGSAKHEKIMPQYKQPNIQLEGDLEEALAL